MITKGFSVENARIASWSDLMEWFRRLVEGFPHVEYAKINYPVSRWVYVKFSKPFKEKPVVLAVTEGYSFSAPVFEEIPKINLPRLGLNRLSLPRLSLPEWRRDDMAPIVGDWLKQEFIRRAGDWGLLNWLRDRFADIFYYIGYVVGYAENCLWDWFIKPFADQLNNKIKSFTDQVNSLIENFENQTNQQLENIVNQTNSLIEQIQDTINSKIISNLNKTIQHVRNQILKFLQNYGASVAPTRNISVQGLEVFVPANTTVYILAIGM